MELINLIKVITPAVIAFGVGIAITPVLTHYLYRYRAWKKYPGKVALDGTEAVEFNRLHKERERNVPRMGGIIIWGSALITIIGMSLLALLWPTAETVKMDFLSRAQTWIPLFALVVGALVGLVNDFLDIYGEGKGLPLRGRLLVVVMLSAFVGWWFYERLDITAVGIPFLTQPLEIGWLIIPFFIIITTAIYASGIIDGLDGLAGGVFASIFAAYAIIALAQQQVDLAAFSAMLVGAILAFVWFNIPPARFFMTETGSMALTLALATIVFMTDTLGEGIGIAVFPIIGFLLVVTVLSSLLQTLSKRFRGRKLFRIAPLHHHFEAVGWPSAKVVMRYWVLSAIFAFVGIIIALTG